jgi:predicted ATPase/DNA-binding SARP family transcriptional activator
MASLDYRLLGSLEVLRDGEKLPLGGHKQRSVLALLLLEANRVVSPDTLIEALWPEQPPARPLTAVQVHVSQLRKVLEPDRLPDAPYTTLVTEPAGYSLALDPGTLDTERLTSLLDRAQTLLADAPERALRLMDEALELFRGPPLADFSYESWAQPRIASLEELRLAVVELRLEAGLALGRHAELVGELEALVAEHPLREGPRRQLMLALYRAGRQADALAAYQAARETLVEELGIDPGPELQRLYRAILNQDEALAPKLLPPSTDRPELPMPTTPLVGRSQEVADVCTLLERDDVRLVTLTGPGGIGKTRLALEVARSVASDGVPPARFVAFAPVRDPALVLPTVAQALGVEESSQLPLPDLIAERIGASPSTLVLDNFEQLVDAAPEIGDLIDRCPRLTLLVTSRERLRLSSEHEYPVLPLSESEAIELFATRAQMAAPAAGLGGDEVGAICRRLDCLPLAIELAAARARLIEPRAMLRRLNESLPLLTGGPRDVPERQRALRSTIDWSYELLPEHEAGVFRRLAVFAGGFTAEAAEAVGGADFEDVGQLVDKSLLRPVPGAEEPRFSMLQTVREYAFERLDQEGEADVLRERHAQWALELARLAAPHLRTREQVAWHDRLAADQDNLRAALEWSLASAPELAVALAAAVAPFYDSRASLVEGIGWLTRALETGAAIGTVDEAYALYWLTWLCDKRGDSTRREELNRRALATFSRVGDVRGTVVCLNQLARAALTRGGAEEAAKLCNEAATAARSSGDDAILADSLTVLADIAEHRGDTERALELELETLELRRQLGDRRGIGVSLNALGWALLLGRRYEEALGYVRESAVVAREIGDRPLEAYALGNLGLASLLAQDVTAAEASLREALALAHELGLWAVSEEALHGLAGVAASGGDFDRFMRLSAAAARMREGSSLEATPPELLIDEQWLPEAQAALGEAALQAAAVAGGSMTAEEAVAYAST